MLMLAIYQQIMSSGAPSSVPIGLTDKTWLEPYTQLLNLTNCDNTTFGQEVGCLRNHTAQEILDAQLTIISNPNWTSR